MSVNQTGIQISKEFREYLEDLPESFSKTSVYTQGRQLNSEQNRLVSEVSKRFFDLCDRSFSSIAEVDERLDLELKCLDRVKLNPICYFSGAEKDLYTLILMTFKCLLEEEKKKFYQRRWLLMIFSGSSDRESCARSVKWLREYLATGETVGTCTNVEISMDDAVVGFNKIMTILVSNSDKNVPEITNPQQMYASLSRIIEAREQIETKSFVETEDSLVNILVGTVL